MSGYNDIYGSEQYYSNLPMGLPNARSAYGGSHLGYYEDRLRFDQYGIPAKLNCMAPNPYIKDDIRKSQRHLGLPNYDIKQRNEIIAENSLEPGLLGDEKAMSSGQVSYMYKNDNQPQCQLNCNDKSEINKEKKTETFVTVGDTKLSGVEVMMLFILIIVIVCCCYCYNAIEELKKTLTTRGSSPYIIDK